MNKVFFYIVMLVCLMSCREITEFYTKDYKSIYARPIGLMMSKEFDSLNLTGNGVKIGVIDTGFGKFKTNEFTKRLHVVDFKDFISSDSLNFFSETQSDHGTIVTTAIGGRNDKNQIHGLARDAEYYLAATDIQNTEPIDDEVRLISAIKWLVSKDVTLINISLGYTYFDNYKPYTNQNLDGKYAKSSKYIDSLLSVRKDIIIVASAGNEGDESWKHITFPGDVKDIITVGSTDFDGMLRYPSSGIGVDYVSYIKPEVCTYPYPSGNSNTAPVITGLIAALLQFKKMDRYVLKQMLIECSTNAMSPNREIGYGVPQTEKLMRSIRTYN